MDIAGARFSLKIREHILTIRTVQKCGRLCLEVRRFQPQAIPRQRLTSTWQICPQGQAGSAEALAPWPRRSLPPLRFHDSRNSVGIFHTTLPFKTDVAVLYVSPVGSNSDFYRGSFHWMKWNYSLTHPNKVTESYFNLQSIKVTTNPLNTIWVTAMEVGAWQMHFFLT